MKILFMCVANSARSQLAEALARQVMPSFVQIQSAGSQPSKVNPFALKALQEVGADISTLHSKSVADLPEDFLQNLDLVITLCAEEVCPNLLSKAKKLHWPLPDPAGLAGTESEQLERFRSTRNAIHQRLSEFRNELLN